MLQGHVTRSPSYIFLDVLEDGDLAAFLLASEGNGGKLLRHTARGSGRPEEMWRSFLERIKNGEGVVPVLICCTGDPAAIRAIRAVYADALIQVSLSHRLRALGEQLSREGRSHCLDECRRIFSALDRPSAVLRFRAWRDRWLSRGERGVRTLEGDLGWCLTFYRFPPELRRTIRSLHLLRRASRAARAVQAPSPAHDPPPEVEPLPQAPPAQTGDGILVHVDTLVAESTFAQTLEPYRRDRLRVAQTASAIASAIGLAARLVGRGH